ncbi:hypothetical protein D3C71_2067920 [compost metagenome]
MINCSLEPSKEKKASVTDVILTPTIPNARLARQANMTSKQRSPRPTNFNLNIKHLQG